MEIRDTSNELDIKDKESTKTTRSLFVESGSPPTSTITNKFRIERDLTQNLSTISLGFYMSSHRVSFSSYFLTLLFILLFYPGTYSGLYKWCHRPVCKMSLNDRRLHLVLTWKKGVKRQGQRVLKHFWF